METAISNTRVQEGRRVVLVCVFCLSVFVVRRTRLNCSLCRLLVKGQCVCCLRDKENKISSGGANKIGYEDAAANQAQKGDQYPSMAPSATVAWSYLA